MGYNVNGRDDNNKESEYVNGLFRMNPIKYLISKKMNVNVNEFI